MISAPHFPVLLKMNIFSRQSYFKSRFHHSQTMYRGSKEAKKQRQLIQSRSSRSCNALCCSSCRLSVSSSEEAESSSSTSDRFPAISSLSHAMVQERLDQMIRERKEARQEGRRMRRRSREGTTTKFLVMLAMEKSSYDPRMDFKESMEQMIVANKICEPKDLRRLLNCYVSMNSDEYRGIILEAFHEVCTNLFSSCTYN